MGDPFYDPELLLDCLLQCRVPTSIIYRELRLVAPEFDAEEVMQHRMMPDRAERRAEDEAKRRRLKDEFRRRRQDAK